MLNAQQRAIRKVVGVVLFIAVMFIVAQVFFGVEPFRLNILWMFLFYLVGIQNGALLMRKQKFGHYRDKQEDRKLAELDEI